MHYTIKTSPVSAQTVDCLIIPIWADKQLSDAALDLDTASHGYLSHWLSQGDLDGKLGQTALLYQVPHLQTKRVLLVGCGDKTKFTPTQFQTVVTCAIKSLANSGVKTCGAYLIDFALTTAQDTYWQYRQAIIYANQACYRFDNYKSEKETFPKALSDICFLTLNTVDDKKAEVAHAQGVAISAGMQLACDLANAPCNVCTPTYLAEQALATGLTHPSLAVSVLEKADLEKLGMNAMLAVSRGSDQPPKLITIEYKGGNADQKPIMFVGKGLTFDSGGISLKPGLGMDEMKYDMCGAADVLGILLAVAQLKLPMNVIGVMACCENLPDGKAYKPGDVVTTSSGQTIEIMNTDAEGRVVLSDALTYCEKFNPEIVVDIATLTGAIIIALGDKASGLMTQDNELANALIVAGEKSWDRVWRLPLWDEYQEQIKSSIADMMNIGNEGGKSITAACLLSRFTKKYRWAHLDIAGTAWRSGKDKGATGRAIPLLIQFLLDRQG